MVKRILIADDSVTIQKALAMTFLGTEDLMLTGVRSADEGLTVAQKARPDLIIADGVMPGRSGYDLCAQIRSDPALRGVPVYILASGQQPYDEARGLKAGVDGHLLKPWDTNAFLEKVRDALSKGATAGVQVARTPASSPEPSPVAPGGRSTSASLPASAMEDDYGEISIDGGRDAGPITPPPVPVLAGPPPTSAPPRSTATSMPAIGLPGGLGMRPSLIPGMRPGAFPPARPGTVPVRPVSGSGGFAPSAPPRPSMPPVGRTMIGLPAANAPIAGAMRPAVPSVPPLMPLAPPRAPTGPLSPLAAPAATAPAFAPRAREMTPTPPPTVISAVDQRLAAIAARGPEYEAIAKLSREIIERIVWEVVPDLAEAILRERIDKPGV
jgi:CheY-like chemotaxis protein